MSLCFRTHALVYDYFGIHVTKVRQPTVSLSIYMYVQRETCVYTMLTTSELVQVCCMSGINVMARLAQSAERKAHNLVVVGSSPTVGAY